MKKEEVERIEYQEIYSGPGSFKFVVDFGTKEMKIKCWNSNENKQISLKDEDIDMLIAKLNFCNVERWRRFYEHDVIIKDATTWKLLIKYNNKRTFISEGEKFPTRWKEYYASIREFLLQVGITVE